jgi:hypothetical protein
MPRNKNWREKDTARKDRQGRPAHPRAPLSDKRITVQLVRCDPGSTVVEVLDSRPDVINAEHTVQQAVLAVYRLPGQSHAVTLHRVTLGGVIHMWWGRPGGERQFLEDWYPRIRDGDVVRISVFFDEDQEVHPGPGDRKAQPDTAGPYPAEHSAAHTAGPHDQLCRCVPCSLAALLSLQ